MGERKIKRAFSIFDSPHPTLSRWRGVVVLRADIVIIFPSTQEVTQ
jgi:hypothetical protein